MKKSYLWVIAVMGIATLLGSCSKEGNDIENIGAENVEIMAKSKALSLEVSTKAPYEGTIGNGNDLTAKVVVSKTSWDYTTKYADGTMTFTNQTDEKGFDATGFSGNKLYPGNDDIHMIGLYPTDNWTVGATAAHTVDGKSDLMYAAQKTTKKETGAPTLEFKHLLTRLNISVIAENSDVAAAWGSINELTLTANNAAAITIADGSVYFGSTAGTINFYLTGSDNVVNGTNTLPITATETSVAYSMVTPISLLKVATAQDAYTLSLKTTTSSAAISVPVKVTTDGSFDYTAGYAFNITLTFKGTEIKAKATVTDWKAGGSGAGEII